MSDERGMALTSVVREVELHAARAGWDQPAQLYALVDTEELLANEPGLAEVVGAGAGLLTPVEQDAGSEDLESLLTRISWPEEVAGCAVVLERLSLPPHAEAGLPEDADAAAEYAASHPDRQEVRIAAGVLRGGTSMCAVRHRAHDEDDAVGFGADLVPALLQLLHATLLDPPPDPTGPSEPTP